MRIIGIDLGKRQSDVCILEHGKVAERFKVGTHRDALSKRFGGNQPRCTIAIESCRDSGWVYAHLTALGHEVVVTDTTRGRQIGIGQGRRKNDRRDAEALARALLNELVPRAHVLTEKRRKLRNVLHARQKLVATRSSLVTLLRGQFQGEGYLVPSCEAVSFAKKLRSSALPGVEAPEVQALLAVLDGVDEQIEVLTAHLEALAQQEEAYERLSSIPGVKLISAMGFIAALDEPTRFSNAKQVGTYLGLVPSESSTGGRQRLGKITRCGNKMARQLLVQAAHSLMRTKSAQTDPLVVWAKQVAERRGKRIAAVGLARRLAAALWAMWMDGTFYDPQGLARASSLGLSRRARRAQQDAMQMTKLAA